MRHTNRKALIVVGIVVLLGIAGIGSISSSAQQNASYYNNSTTEIGNASWMEDREDPTLGNTSHFISRIATTILGSGDLGAGANALLSGLLVSGLFVGAIGRSRTGVVGGATMGILVAAGLTAAGYAPTWVYGVLLAVVGIIVATVLIRSTD